MNDEQRQELIRLLQHEEDISPEWARILFPPEKREYELVYYGKAREEDIIADTLAVPLQPVRTFGGNGVDWHNMLVFGDNLQAMKTLLEMKKEGRLCNADGTPGVRLVYIDPPFATKEEFRGTEDQKAYQDKISGAVFLEFLRKRLLLIRELLADQASVYIHLDTRKVHYIKTLMDEILGEGRFKNEIIWKRTSAHSDSSTFANVHDTILFYAGSDAMFSPQYVPYTETYTAERYKHVDGKGRRFADDNLIGTGLKGGGYVYEWKGVNKNWRCPIETMKQYESQDRLYYTKQGVARIKRYLDELPGMSPLDLWIDIYPVNSQADERMDYPTQKPESLMARIIASSSNQGDIVLDAFPGSGTTCAVAEKLGRRWIGIDCGKLAIYTMQKRMLNLRKEIGNKGAKLDPKPFTLYNAGLYDFSKLKELAWDDWRFFALQLFQCRDERHRVNGIDFDGYRQGASVLVFNHMDKKHKGARITEETIEEIHEVVGSWVGSKVFIIAPALTFDFQQDYINFGKVRYYALRIPYSIIHELHRREFTALKQPSDEMAVNDTVEAVGFDFIRTPELKYKTGREKAKGDSAEYGYIKIEIFKSDAIVREPFKKRGNLETLSMVMVDFDYDEKSKVFDFDEIYYADEIGKAEWKVRFRVNQLGRKMMIAFLDIYGNEARVLIDRTEFGNGTTNKSRKMK